MLKPLFHYLLSFFPLTSDTPPNSPTVSSDSYPHPAYQIYNYHASHLTTNIIIKLGEKLNNLTDSLVQISHQTYNQVTTCNYLNIGQICLEYFNQIPFSAWKKESGSNYDNFQFVNVNKQTGHLPNIYSNHPPLGPDIIRPHDTTEPPPLVPVELDHTAPHFPPLIIKKQNDLNNHDYDSLEVPCNICLQRLPRKVLIPCGHAYCNSCLNKLVVCPRCRSEINGVMKIYL